MRSWLTIVSLFAVVLVARATHGWTAGRGTDPQSFDQIERGRSLAIAGDCAACHTLPDSGRELAGGRVIVTPFGHLLAPNITPDRETGIGAWTDEEFIGALTRGTGRGGELLYPAMPYTYMTKLSREDAIAIRAYLNTLPAVRNPVRSNQLPFPFDIRSSMRFWNALYFKPGPFEPVPAKSNEWNRGAYLVEGIAHCGMCHTPKNWLGADQTSKALQGYALQGQFAPDITNDQRLGLGNWSVDDIVQYLATGHNITAAATGLMAEMVQLSTSKMSEGDLHAIAVYLKDPPTRPPQQSISAADQGLVGPGAAIYRDECSGCHTSNGAGIPGLFPALAGAPGVQQTDATSLLRVVLGGARSAATEKAPTGPAMPSFAWLLTDTQVAAVLNYVRNSWGNAAPPVKPDVVAKARKALSAH